MIDPGLFPNEEYLDKKGLYEMAINYPSAQDSSKEPVESEPDDNAGGIVESMRYIHNVAIYLKVSVTSDNTFNECRLVKVPIQNKSLAGNCYCKKLRGASTDFKDEDFFRLSTFEHLRTALAHTYRELGFNVVDSFIGIDDSDYKFSKATYQVIKEETKDDFE